jgi:hypothetical protein
MQDRDEWPLIGVHLETRVEEGMTIDDAANSLILDGVDTVRVRAYLDRVGLNNSDRLEQLQKLYTREEIEIIQRWILKAPYLPDDDGTLAGDANRVAEIVLFRIRRSLPQWAEVYHNGKVQFSREHQLRLIKKRDDLLIPTYLCGINWADTGPGMSWPEEYHLTLLPGYNVYVLTASQDSNEVHGYADLALACIPATDKNHLPLKDSLQVIRNWWQAELDLWDQSPWEQLLSAGVYNPFKLIKIRDKIWSGWEI